MQHGRRMVTALQLAVWALLLRGTALAQTYGVQETSSTERFLVRLVTGGFGTFVIIFMGLGGIASIFMTREGDSSKGTPILGIVMLCIALLTFAYRVMIGAGMMGHEHIDW